jgi:hypothetical protein
LGVCCLFGGWGKETSVSMAICIHIKFMLKTVSQHGNIYSYPIINGTLKCKDNNNMKARLYRDLSLKLTLKV